MLDNKDGSISPEINNTLNQHHFKVEFLDKVDDDTYQGISDGKID